MKRIFFNVFILSLLLLSFARGLHAQIVEGVVFNELKEPLLGATVSIKPHNIIMSTNSKGIFQFSNIPLGEIQLTVSYIGYQKQVKNINIKATSHEKLNFPMKIETNYLSEISISRAACSANNTEEISQNYLQRTQAVDMKDIFTDLPSVIVGGGGADAQRLYLRGVEGSSLNIRIDGAKQGRSLFQHRGNGGSIDPGLLKQVSVSTGADATHGSGGLGGSITFETIDAQDLQYRYGKIGGKVSTGLTSASNGYITRAILGTKITPHIGLLVSSSLNDQANYKSADNGIIPNTAAKAQNYFAKLSILDYKSHELRLSSTYNRNSGHYKTGGPGSDMGIPVEGKANYQVMSRGTQSLDYSFAPKNPLINMNANAYYNYRNLKDKDSKLDVSSNNLGLSVKNDLKFTINKLKNTLTVGSDYEKEDGISTSSIKNKEQTNTSTVFGVFAQGLSEFSFFSLTYGLRLDDYKNDFGPKSIEGNQLSPNAGVTIMPLKGLQFFANYSEAVRASGTIPIQWMANITENTNFNDGKSFEPETSVMSEAGFKYVKEDLFFPNSKFILSLKVFETKMDNLIERAGGGPGLVSKIWNQSLGITSQGYETSLNWQVKNLQTQLSYVHTTVEDENGNSITVARGKAASTGDRFNWNIMWQATPELQLGYTLNTIGELQDVYKITRPSYTLHNIQVLWFSQTIKGFSTAIAINNLLDKQYSEQTSITQGEAIISEPGRDIRLTLSYKF